MDGLMQQLTQSLNCEYLIVWFRRTVGNGVGRTGFVRVQEVKEGKVR